MDKFIEKMLIEYVTEQHLDQNAEIEIMDFCSEQKPLSITVYRGHTKIPIIKSGLWYSASTDINVAANEFAGNDCCIFIIHLLDIPCIDINKYIGNKIGDKKDEKEIIFLGGGTFYKNNDLTEEGFIEKTNNFNKRTFECWYSLSKLQPETQPEIRPETRPKIKTNNIDYALRIIDPEEYEFINSVDDIIINDSTLTLSNDEKQQVLDEIIKRKTIGGKNTKKYRKKRKNKKRKSKKRRQLSKGVIRRFKRVKV